MLLPLGDMLEGDLNQRYFCPKSSITCGVVTITAPVILQLLKYCTIDKCSSDVPGGVSTTK
jgi:hypothetical protein